MLGAPPSEFCAGRPPAGRCPRPPPPAPTRPVRLPCHAPASAPLTALPGLARGEKHQLRAVGEAPEVISGQLRAVFVQAQAGAGDRELRGGRAGGFSGGSRGSFRPPCSPRPHAHGTGGRRPGGARSRVAACGNRHPAGRSNAQATGPWITAGAPCRTRHARPLDRGARGPTPRLFPRTRPEASTRPAGTPSAGRTPGRRPHAPGAPRFPGGHGAGTAPPGRDSGPRADTGKRSAPGRQRRAHPPARRGGPGPAGRTAAVGAGRSDGRTRGDSGAGRPLGGPQLRPSCCRGGN